MKILSEPRMSEPLNKSDLMRELREIRAVLAQCPVIWDYGTPEGNVVGNVGHLYLRLDGGATTTLYVKESGAGSKTGWVAK